MGRGVGMAGKGAGTAVTKTGAGTNSTSSRDKRLTTAAEEHLRALLLRGLGGDAVAYHRFLQDLSARLRAFLRRRLAQLPDEIEDLVQETLLAVHVKRHTYDPRQPLTAWVHAIAKYKLVDHLRRQRFREWRSEPFDDENELLATSDTEAADAHRDVWTLLAELPDRQRLPIIHVKLHGASVAEAARATGMSESAVKVNVHRGLKALAARLRGAQ
jgi:RNA polymerase sigma-70 factor (ECF subfamily)